MKADEPKILTMDARQWRRHEHAPVARHAAGDGSDIEDCACGGARAVLETGYVSTWHACVNCSKAVASGAIPATP